MSRIKLKETHFKRRGSSNILEKLEFEIIN